MYSSFLRFAELFWQLLEGAVIGYGEKGSLRQAEVNNVEVSQTENG